MNQRTALIVAAALTAFVLVTLGGLAGRMGEAVAPTAAPTLAAATAGMTGPPTLDPAVDEALRKREATYQTALAEAGARLEAANAEIARANAQIAQATADRQRLQEQLGQAQPQAAQGPAASSTAPVSPEQAAQAAQTYRGGGQVGEVHLEREHGVAAFEVKFTDGSTVYVDAGTGQVIYARIAAERGDDAEDRTEREDD